MFNVLDMLKRLLFFAFEILRIPVDLLRRTQHRTYSVSIDVDAPKSVTWSIVSARKITLEGALPITLDTSPDPTRPGIYSGTLSFAQRVLPITYRIVEEHPEQAMLLAMIQEESAPDICPGRNYVSLSTLEGDEKTSRINLRYELTHEKLSTRLLMPLSALQAAGRLKYNAELRAGSANQSTSAQVKNAAITAALTFASFLALFGMQDAALLIALILVHEVGHAVAMWWVGMPVKGIYFIPFMGGVAVSAGRYHNEGERGFVSLMGPGFSVLSTALLFAMSQNEPQSVFLQATIMSAFLNGFNLLPVLPLDGGHIAQSLLSRVSPRFVTGFNGLTLLAGAGLAVAISAYDLLVVLLLIAPLILSKRMRNAPRLEALTGQQLFWLGIGYAATIAFYAAILAAAVPPASSGPA